MIRCRMRILLVEDDRKLADYVRRSLEEEHNTVTVCFDGAAGLEEARKENHDAIVLDVMMPVMDGFEVTRRIRTWSPALSTPRACPWISPTTPAA